MNSGAAVAPVAKNLEFVAFRAAGQDFCFDIQKVREIRGWTEPAILPHAPDYVLGVINLRGLVVPIVDLSRRLGLPPLTPKKRHVIIIALIGTRTVGLLVESVSDIICVSSTDVQPAPDVASDATRSFIEGVIACDDRMIRAINIDSMLPQSITKS